MNKRNHYSCDVVVKKIMEEEKKISLQEAVDMAAWTHNYNVNIHGFTPLQLATGKNVIFPGISTANEASESVYDDELVRKIMERHREVMKQFREQEFLRKLEIALKTRTRGYEDKILREEDLVYYQIEDKKAWLGPERVFAVKGNSVFLFANGNMKKIPRCNVKLCGRKEVEFVDEEEKGEEPKEMKDSEVKDSFGDNIEEDDVEDIERMRTRSMERRRKELEKDSISTFWMKFENEECYDDIAVYAVEVPRVEHKKIEVIEAKEK